MPTNVIGPTLIVAKFIRFSLSWTCCWC